uniref:Uncharacterized protein n=1 Tax=uncultured Desulfobacterium sp. TaxID=201089 RepID=E1YCW3_9BACT|nr:unknown protein [uncultured Desulfobacterium sp.]
MARRRKHKRCFYSLSNCHKSVPIGYGYLRYNKKFWKKMENIDKPFFSY